jgi:hypothetical protein
MLQSMCKFCCGNQLRETWHFFYRHKWNYIYACTVKPYVISTVKNTLEKSLTTPFAFLFFKPLVPVVDWWTHGVILRQLNVHSCHMILGICRSVNDVFTLLGCYAVWIGRWFQDNLSVAYSGVRQVGPVSCPKILVTNYQSMLLDIEEERRPPSLSSSAKNMQSWPFKFWVLCGVF